MTHEVAVLQQEKFELTRKLSEAENKLVSEIAKNVALQCEVRNLRGAVEMVYRSALDATLSIKAREQK